MDNLDPEFLEAARQAWMQTDPDSSCYAEAPDLDTWLDRNWDTFDAYFEGPRTWGLTYEEFLANDHREHYFEPFFHEEMARCLQYRGQNPDFAEAAQ